MFYKYEAEKGTIMITKSVILKMIAEIIERYDGKAIFASSTNQSSDFNQMGGKPVRKVIDKAGVSEFAL